MRDISYAELRLQCDAAVAALEVLTAEAAKRDRAALVQVYDNIKATFDGDLGEDTMVWLVWLLSRCKVRCARCYLLSNSRVRPTPHGQATLFIKGRLGDFLFLTAYFDGCRLRDTPLRGVH